MHGPGLVGLVTDQGEQVFEGAIGVTDLADGRRPTADDWFRIGSVTKTYVSAVLVQLLREGAFARTDTVEQWLPGLVPGGDQLPVELLLRMRSGLPDYAWAILGTPRDLSRVTGYRRPEQLVEVALAQPDRHPPGESFRYCNTGAASGWSGTSTRTGPSRSDTTDRKSTRLNSSHPSIS